MSHSKGKWIKCNEETDGFFGLYRAPAEMTGKGRCAMILPSDDNADDHLAKSELKWAHELGIGALTISPNKQDTGLHDWPVEHFESAVKFLKSKGHTKIGVLGLSSGSLMALTAASLIEDITLTIALTPVDFILGGYLHDNLDGAGERPAEGESTFTFRGERLPYLPYFLHHPDYWNRAREESKRRGAMIAAYDLYNEIEERGHLTEDMKIKIENIRGHLFLATGLDDIVWPADKYVRRMEQRLGECEPKCTWEVHYYDHATHFIFPERMIRNIVPGFLVNPVLKWAFPEARGYTKECRETRIDLDNRIAKLIENW